MNLTMKDIILLSLLLLPAVIFVYKVMYCDPEDELPELFRDGDDER